MRWLTKHDRDDRGVVTLLVIGIITALLLASGAAIDVSRFSQENSSAQHSADATAMAVATDCVLTGAPKAATTYEVYRKTPAQVIAPATPINASSCSTGTVRITVNKDVNGGLFLNRDARLVHKTATVQWGAINSATTIPAVISQCTFDLATASGTTFPSAEQIIPLGSGGPACPGRPPGAFGWLDTGLDGPCSIKTTLNASGKLIVHGNNGNGNGSWWDCITSVGVNGTLLVPIYGASCNSPSPCVQGQNDGNGSNNYYLILGFAEIQITGWNLQHGSPNRNPTGTVPSCPGSGSASCIRGRFVRFATQLGSSGPGTNFGVQTIFLSS
jgi:Flp pilus assembly protein TadG